MSDKTLFQLGLQEILKTKKDQLSSAERKQRNLQKFSKQLSKKIEEKNKNQDSTKADKLIDNL
jgi:hypothetical protein